MSFELAQANVNLSEDNGLSFFPIVEKFYVHGIILVKLSYK